MLEVDLGPAPGWSPSLNPFTRLQQAPKYQLGIEVKLSASADSSDVKHLLWLREHLKDDLPDLIVVTTGKYAYRRQDGVAVVPLALLGA